MGAALLFLAAAASVGGSAAAPVLEFRREAVVAHPDLRLGDLVDVAILPQTLRNHARSLILTQLNDGRRTATISDRVLVSRARAIMPALRPWLPTPTGQSINVRWRTDERAEIAKRSCARAKRAVVAGADLFASDFEKAECIGKPPSVTRHDPATGVSRAHRQIAAGELVRSWPGLEGGQIAAGQKLLIESGSGAVRIERAAQAVQSAWPGQHVFVRSGDGQLHSIRYKDVR